MRNRVGILLGIVLLVFILIGLNAATYVQREKTPDSETNPNRSSFNSGSTGTQAFYTLLAESGRKVTRWQRPVDELRTERRNKPSTLVVIGETRRPFNEVEIKALMDWVHGGGHLVLIDRRPSEEMLASLAQWKLSANTFDMELMLGADQTDQKQMTSEMPASKPVQPSLFTSGVNAVQTSKFASSLKFQRNDKPRGTAGEGSSAPPPYSTADTYDDEISTAPVVHLSGAGRNTLVEARHGFGKIAILTDPWVVSNSGISLVDNAQLGINLVSTGGGLIAFDEYHQGYGSDHNRFFQFFAGTPVIAVFAQLALIAGLVFYSRSRRFARPVPEPEPDRRSKLEYVSAMAELQQRTQAFDLAIENIYSDFRRRVSRLFGVDNKMTGRKQMAALIAERIKGDAAEIGSLMLECEDIAHGEPTGKQRAVKAAARLRELELRLGLARNSGAKRAG